MKQLIFIDDGLEKEGYAVYLLMKEIRKIFEHDKQKIDVLLINCCIDPKYHDFIDDTGELAYPNNKGYESTNNTVIDVFNQVKNMAEIMAEDGRIELAIDLCLQHGKDYNVMTGCNLAKYIITHLDKRLFDEKKVVISLCSTVVMTMEGPPEALKKEFPDIIETCTAPIIRDMNNVPRIDTDKIAYPMFLSKYKVTDNDKTNMINHLLYYYKDERHTGSVYGNFFGMLYARLFK